MPYIAGVLIDVITDVKPNESSTTTDHALEDLSQISDHVVNNPITISLSGVIHDESDAKIAALRKARENGTIFSFDYMTGYSNMIITDLSPDYNASIKDGYKFSMTLKQVKTVKAASFGAAQSSSLQRQTATVASRGLVQTSVR